jgi:hypothetical protein
MHFMALMQAFDHLEAPDLASTDCRMQEVAFYPQNFHGL